MYADGILLDEGVWVGGWVGGDLSISRHYCFLKSLVIHHIGRHLLQRTGNVHLIKETEKAKHRETGFLDKPCSESLTLPGIIQTCSESSD